MLAIVHDVFRWLCALTAAGVLTGFAFLLVTGEYINDGAVVVQVTHNHGLHKGDVFVMAGWAVAMLALAGLLVASRRRRATGRDWVSQRSDWLLSELDRHP